MEIVRVGASKVALSRELGRHHMCGYSVASKVANGSPAAGDEQELHARTLVIEVATGERFAFIFADLWGPSAGLAAQLGRAAAADLRLPESHLLFATTHTHTGPSRYFNNKLWNYAPTLTLDAGANDPLVKLLLRRLREGLDAAVADLAPGSVDLVGDELWGVGAQRSEAAFLAGGTAAAWVARFRTRPGLQRDVLHTMVDPRLRALRARRADGSLRALFGVYACHATALGQAWSSYSADWPGIATTNVERQLSGVGPPVVVALAQGAAGDVSPLPPSGGYLPADPSRCQGIALARQAAQEVSAEMLTLAALPSGPPRADFEWESTCWNPGSSLPRPLLGAPALGGAEDYRSPLWTQDLACREGSKAGPPVPAPPDQAAKWGSHDPITAIALSQVNAKAGPTAVPLRRIRLAGHVIFTCPGEPTGWALAELERQFAPAPGCEVLGIGYAGEYIGYLTTSAEFACQHYEGAMTVYGSRSITELAAVLHPTTPWPLAGAPAEPDSAAD